MVIDKNVNVVYETKEYEKFKFLEGNRDINELHLARLKNSFKEGQLQLAIIVNEKFEIIDGQHRYLIIKELGLPLYYIICSGYGLAECQRLNISSKNWSKMDFIKGYAQLGYQDYIKFLEFIEKYEDIGCTRVYEWLLQGSMATNRGSYQDDKTKNGNFKIKDWEYACEMAEMLLDFKTCSDVWKLENFKAAVIKIIRLKNYNHERMIRKLKLCFDKVSGVRKVPEFLDKLTEVYNYKESKQNFIYFKYEIDKSQEED